MFELSLNCSVGIVVCVAVSAINFVPRKNQIGITSVISIAESLGAEDVLAWRLMVREEERKGCFCFTILPGNIQ